MDFLNTLNWQRLLFVIFTLFVWFIINRKTKNSVITSLLYIVLILPYNITALLPTQISISTWTLELTNPYVNSVYSNYLVPFIHILDIGFILLFLSLNSSKISKFIILTLLGFSLIHLILNLNFVTFVYLVRINIYIVSLVRLFGYFLSSVNQLQIRKILTNISGILLLNLIVQLVIGYMQFSKGRSLGLDFLGESKVLSGVIGSSFVTLGGDIFLRAYGTFPHPNVLAGYVLGGVMFLILIYQKNKALGDENILHDRRSRFEDQKESSQFSILNSHLINNQKFKIQNYFSLFLGLFISIILLALTFSRVAMLLGYLIIGVFLVDLAIYQIILKIRKNPQKDENLMNSQHDQKTKLRDKIFINNQTDTKKPNSLNYSFIPFIQERFTNLFTNGDTSVSDRTKLIGTAMQVIKRKWLSGSGAGNFVNEMDKIVPTTTSGISLLQQVHNIFLLILSEYGLLMGIPIVLLLIFILARKVLITKTFRQFMYKSLFVIAFLAIGITDHYLLTLPQGIVLSLIFVIYF